MSIQSEIARITNKRDASLTAVSNKGVLVPSGSTIDDLPSLIDQIDVSSQAKTVTPTFSTQTITPDSPTYSFLSQVTVSAINVTYEQNAAGGITVTIGAV